MGIISVFASALMYAQAGSTDVTLLLLGLAVSGIAFLTILMGNQSVKFKLFWTLFVFVSAGIFFITEEMLRKTSYRIFIALNQDSIDEINNILTPKQGEIYIYKDTILSQPGCLTEKEKAKLKELRKKVDVYMIWKMNSDIYYGIKGFLNYRVGVCHVINGNKPKIQLVHAHLSENWYY